MILFIRRHYKSILLISAPLLVAFFIFISYQYKHTSTNQYCGTCHIMKPVYESSFHSIHREGNGVNCRDCHIPQDNFPEALVYKGYSGAKDYYKNTFNPPDVLHTTAWSRRIIQKNCINCHETVMARVQISEERQCFDCHRGVPHDQFPQTLSLEKTITPIR